jgi:tRNA pseudouridine55 synthase
MSDPRPKIVRRAISGVFLLNKPQGYSSNGILQKVRWLYRAQKAGHTGALDPLATGLLPICLGEATKFSHYLLDSDKTYQTVVQLGATTTTGDKEGDILKEFDIPVLTAQLIESALAKFRGPIMQVPPMYSALKKDGRPLYELARQGIEIDRPARPVTIYTLTLDAFDATMLTLTVKCSKGTYIRTLAEDIGAALGCGGHVAALHRTQTASFVLDKHNTIEYLESLDDAGRDALLLPTYAAVEYLPRMDLSLDEAVFFSRGQAINAGDAELGETLAFDEYGRFLGLGVVDKFRTLHPKRVVN